MRLEETLGAFNDLVRSGKVRYIGFSNLTGAQLQKIVDYSKFLGFNLPVVLQVWHLLDSCLSKGLVLDLRDSGGGLCRTELSL